MVKIRMVTKILSKLKLIFLPKRRIIYVVLEGKFKGEWLVKIRVEKNTTVCFSLPDKHICKIPNNEFEWGIKNKVLEPVDVLPEAVYNVCIAEYNLKATDIQKREDINKM